MTVKINESSESVIIGDHVVKVIRTKRLKTVSIRVIDDAVTITVPMALKTHQIMQILEKKHSWISKKRQDEKRRVISPKQTSWLSTNTIYFLGEKYQLNIVNGDQLKVSHTKTTLLITLPLERATENEIQKCLIDWYIQQAETIIKHKVAKYTATVGVQPNRIQIKRFKSRWGSCNQQGGLQFNWLIVMAPSRVIDYVVIHELCHLLQMNHSPKFWQEVKRVMPDYVQHHQWLKANGHQLMVF